MAIRHNKNKAGNRLSLDDIFSGPDEFGLLDVAFKAVSQNTPIEITNFEAINTFVDHHGRAPNQDGDLAEKLLARRLAVYQNNSDFHLALVSYDRYGLLVLVNKELVEQSAELASRVLLDEL